MGELDAGLLAEAALLCVGLVEGAMEPLCEKDALAVWLAEGDAHGELLLPLDEVAARSEALTGALGEAVAGGEGAAEAVAEGRGE